MKTQDVIEFFGGTGKAGAALGISSQAVSQWGPDVPASRLKTVEMAMKLEEMARAKEAKKKRA
jgi:hypothetical protein